MSDDREDDPRHYPDPCDWCEKLIWPGDVLLANFGGRFCSDECASLYEQDFTAHLAPEEVAALSAEELAALRQRKVS